MTDIRIIIITTLSVILFSLLISVNVLASPAEESAPAKEAVQLSGNLNTVENRNKNLLNSYLLNVSLRTRFSGANVIGTVAPEEFWEYAAAANFKLPWARYSQSGWGVGTRLMASAGILSGSGENALVVSFIPLIAVGSQNGRFTVDMGAGGALFSRQKFGTQDYGGIFQFALTAGASIPLYKRLGLGYRFMHYSDAALYGHHTTGADFHMLELIYRF